MTSYTFVVLVVIVGMIQVYISPITVSKSITIDVANTDILLSKAILLGASGERLKNFQLKASVNVLSLDEFDSGFYSLRIEAGQEVIVRQITIP